MLRSGEPPNSGELAHAIAGPVIHKRKEAACFAGASAIV